VPYTDAPDDRAIDLVPVAKDALDQWLDSAPEATAAWLRATGFKAKPGEFRLVPGADGAVSGVVFGTQEDGHLWQLAGLAGNLPAGHYRATGLEDRQARVLAALGWGLGAYRFDRYRKDDRTEALLVLDEDIADEVRALHAAQCLVRDLVNTPTEDLGPSELTDALVAEADRFGAETRIIEGDALLDHNYPAIHAVGRAAERAPRLASLEWGDEDHPLLVLVGKGVCFDTGGLNIKPGRGMALMKKDMGGAAHVIALARLVMEAALPVRLLVLVPAVENAISGVAYRPGDVIGTRKGKTVEIGNTDAEGRLVLCDALAEAMERNPDLVLDFATLTGAARVALGPELPPVFCNDRDLADGLLAAGEACEDRFWELPLHKPYLDMLKSEVADINNSGKGGFAGAITAALFLQEFVEPDVPWAHVDTYAWVPNALPGRPVGGEALGLRAAFAYLRERFGD